MKRITVIGDIIVDRHVECVPLGLSAETPTIVVKTVRERQSLGGAGLVARHLVRLGCAIELVSVHDVAEMPSRVGWDPVVKTRFFSGHHKMFQVDALPDDSHDDRSRQLLFDMTLESIARGYGDAVVVCDNRHGCLDEKFVAMLRTVGARVFVDSQVSQKSSNHRWYFGFDTVFVNERELDAAIESMEIIVPETKSIVVKDDDLICDRVKALSTRLGSSVVLKMGARGARALVGGYEVHAPGIGVKTVDTCGAGDAFLAAYVSREVDAGRPETIVEAMQFANRWAALSTTYVGTDIPPLIRLENVE